jgi:hypothetical protein
MLFVAGALAVGAVGAAPALGERSLNWSELAKVKGHGVLRFKVQSISIGKTGWSARVSFRNVSGRTMRVGNVFGLSYFRGSQITPTTRFDAFGRATRFSPAKPASLRPGESWTGVIQGKGRPALTGKVYARILFGPFYGVPGFPNPYYWVTDHSRTVQLAAAAAKPKKGKPKNPLVI